MKSTASDGFEKLIQLQTKTYYVEIGVLLLVVATLGCVLIALAVRS